MDTLSVDRKSTADVRYLTDTISADSSHNLFYQYFGRYNNFVCGFQTMQIEIHGYTKAQTCQCIMIDVHMLKFYGYG